jgi:non-ribosomal peptide synthase protein (TIGR01720 family)
MCVQYFKKEYIISGEAIVENLFYQQEISEESCESIVLHVKRAGVFSGLILWLHAYSDAYLMIDSMERTHHLPVFFPVLEKGVYVEEGTEIQVRFMRRPGPDGLHPDYEIEGKIIKDKQEIAFNYLSLHSEEQVNRDALQRLLFDEVSEQFKVYKEVNAGLLKEYLSNSLPGYMLPHKMIEVDSFPLTPNGKIDKNAIVSGSLKVTAPDLYEAPTNETEEKLAAIWCELLGMEQVGIKDNFFSLGGDSILTIQLVSRAQKAGISITPKDIFEYQTIEKLSKHTAATQVLKAEQGILQGASELLPVQRYFFEHNYAELSHHNQSLLLCVEKMVSDESLEKLSEQIINHHDALRFRYEMRDNNYIQYYGNAEQVFFIEDIITLKSPISLAEEITQICAKYQSGLNILHGGAYKIVLIKTNEWDKYNRLFIVAHHLLIDGVSWRILLEDMERALLQIESGNEIDFGMKTSSYREYANNLIGVGKLKLLEKELNYWRRVVDSSLPFKTECPVVGTVKMKDVRTFTVTLDKRLTEQLLKEVNQVYQTDINDILLAALFETLSDYQNTKLITFGLEGHGREPIAGRELDVSSTIGWFTCLYPVQLSVSLEQKDIGDLIRSIKEQMRRIPGKGIGYGVLSYLHQSVDVRQSLKKAGLFDVVFNYLGQLDNVLTSKSKWFKGAVEYTGTDIGPGNEFVHKLSINSLLTGGALLMNWSYAGSAYEESTIQMLAENYIKNLESIIIYCRQVADVFYTPSDYGLPASVNYKELESFLDSNDSGKKGDMFF